MKSRFGTTAVAAVAAAFLLVPSPASAAVPGADAQATADPTVGTQSYGPNPPYFNMGRQRIYWDGDASTLNCIKDGEDGYNRHLWRAYHCWQTGDPEPVELWVLV